MKWLIEWVDTWTLFPLSSNVEVLVWNGKSPGLHAPLLTIITNLLRNPAASWLWVTSLSSLWLSGRHLRMNRIDYGRFTAISLADALNIWNIMNMIIESRIQWQFHQLLASRIIIPTRTTLCPASGVRLNRKDPCRKEVPGALLQQRGIACLMQNLASMVHQKSTRCSSENHSSMDTHNLLFVPVLDEITKG